MIKQNKIIFGFSVVLCLALSAGGPVGCARMGVNMSGPMISDMMGKVADTGNPRLAKEGLAGQVLLITALTEMSPDNLRLLKECAFAYCSYGLFVEDEDPEYAKTLYATGKEYGLRALKQNSRFAKGLQKGKKISELTDILGKKYTGALCWAGLNGGLLLTLNLDDPGALMEMADIVAMVKRSIALNENYYYGVCKIFLGAYYSMIPSYLDEDGGEENARKMFQEARKSSDGKFLLVDLFEAKFLATTIDDEALFEKGLNHILSSPSDEPKGVRLINELTKIKAQYYLNRQKELF